MSVSLHLLSVTLGWAYVVCWGISLYPPVFLHRKLRSVEGMSIDFAVINFVGCLAYFVSVFMLYYSMTVRLEYQLRHKKIPLVRFNDVVYGAHSLVLVCIVMWQFYLSGYKRGTSQKISRWVKLMAGLIFLGAVGLLLHAWEISTTRRHYELVDVANIFGTAKIVMSSIKYFPQAYFNYSRKSTRGFSITGPWLDILGSVCSVSQLVLDAYLTGDVSDIYKHPVKLLLSLVTFVCSLIFVIQHHIYTERKIPFYNKEA